MTGIVPPGQGHLLTARGNVMAFNAVAEQTGGAGDFLLVPRGAAHTFGNQGAEPARLLVLHAPAMDAYFEELHKLWSAGKRPCRDAERELMSRYGMEPA
jgi:oxalate decarboxylase/phosphoglucose isomerase-like protein (cupin superfamily)